ncbi:MAG: hypothetical protein QG633_303 [Patescibacteria group bacterium]|nr:hypothetical protein [Patescibacteria group bacterium]
MENQTARPSAQCAWTGCSLLSNENPLLYPRTFKARFDLSFDRSLSGSLIDANCALNDVDDAKGRNHDDHTDEPPQDAPLSFCSSFVIIAITDVDEDSPDEDDERNAEDQGKNRLHNDSRYLCHELCERHLRD